MPEITLPKIPDGYDAEIEIKPDGSMKIKLTQNNAIKIPIAKPVKYERVEIVPLTMPAPLRTPLAPADNPWPWWEVTC